MKNKTIFALSVIGVFSVLGLSCVGTVLGFRTDCVAFEAGIPAQFDQNRNNYDNMWKTFKEMAQVTVVYETHIKEVFDGAIKGRYGTNGAKQMFLALKEDNPKLDPSLYTKIQTAIEAGRIGFAADQKQLIDKKRQYNQLLQGNTALIANVFFHFPRIDLNKYDIVTSDVTTKAFTSKKADQIQVF